MRVLPSEPSAQLFASTSVIHVRRSWAFIPRGVIFTNANRTLQRRDFHQVRRRENTTQKGKKPGLPICFIVSQRKKNAKFSWVSVDCAWGRWAQSPALRPDPPAEWRDSMGCHQRLRTTLTSPCGSVPWDSAVTFNDGVVRPLLCSVSSRATCPAVAWGHWESQICTAWGFPRKGDGQQGSTLGLYSHEGASSLPQGWGCNP